MGVPFVRGPTHWRFFFRSPSKTHLKKRQTHMLPNVDPKFRVLPGGALLFGRGTEKTSFLGHRIQ